MLKLGLNPFIPKVLDNVLSYLVLDDGHENL
jgi:hypothetical protein